MVCLVQGARRRRGSVTPCARTCAWSCERTMACISTGWLPACREGSTARASFPSMQECPLRCEPSSEAQRDHFTCLRMSLSTCANKAWRFVPPEVSVRSARTQTHTHTHHKPSMEVYAIVKAQTARLQTAHLDALTRTDTDHTHAHTHTTTHTHTHTYARARRSYAPIPIITKTVDRGLGSFR